MMDMTQGQVVVAFAHIFQFQRVYATNGVFRCMVVLSEVTTLHGCMGCHDHRKSFRIPFRYPVKQLLEETFRDITFIGIRNSNDEPFSWHFDDMLIRIVHLQLPDSLPALAFAFVSMIPIIGYFRSSMSQ